MEARFVAIHSLIIGFLLGSLFVLLVPADIRLFVHVVLFVAFVPYAAYKIIKKLTKNTYSN